MKKNSLLLFFILSLSTISFSQSNMTSKIWRQWTPDEGLWKDMVTEKWKYNSDKRNIEYFRKAHYVVDDFFFELENQQQDSVFDEVGNLVILRYRMWNDTFQYFSETHHSYDENQFLIEMTLWRWDDLSQSMQNNAKTTFERSVDGPNNIVTSKSYWWDILEEVWSKNSENEEIFNQSGCLIEVTAASFFSTGDFRYSNKTINTYDENCLIQSYEYQRKDEGDLDYIPLSRGVYNYSDIEFRFSIERFEDESWTKIEEHVTEYDELGRRTRTYIKDFTSGGSIFYLADFEYDQRGNLSTESYYYQDITPEPNLQFNSRRKYTYFYNAKDLLETKVTIYESVNSSFKTTQRFEYYCDDQLKIETVENLPTIDKYFYEYDNGKDCPEKNKHSTLKIAPNPTSGNLRITSNLLQSPHAKIRLYSAIGKEVFSQAVPSFTSFFNVNFPYLTNGNYLLLIENEAAYKTEKLLILK